MLSHQFNPKRPKGKTIFLRTSEIVHQVKVLACHQALQLEFAPWNLHGEGELTTVSCLLTIHTHAIVHTK